MTDRTLFSSLIRQYRQLPFTYKEAAFFMGKLTRAGQAFFHCEKREQAQARRTLTLLETVAHLSSLSSRYY